MRLGFINGSCDNVVLAQAMAHAIEIFIDDGTDE